MFKKQLILTISTAVGAMIIFGGVILFFASDIKGKAEEIKQLQNTLGFRLRASDSLLVLREDYSKAQEYIPSLETILPTRDQLVTFPREITSQAKEKEVNLNVNLGKEVVKTDKSLGTIEFTMSGQGLFENFISFFKDMESGRYSVKIENLDLTRQETKVKILAKGKVFSF